MARLKNYWISIGLERMNPSSAIALEPGNPEYLDQAAYSAVRFCRSDEALALARRALELDPLNAYSWDVRGQIKYYAGQLEGAEADVKNALALSPDV